tara:strand:+ start:357 stop:1013 length:657 start_codon:yes stop_codon:yes gene_type:complete
MERNETVYDVKKLVEETVNVLVQLEKSFTAFDVTKSIRARYSDFTEPHAVVRDQVHSLFFETRDTGTMFDDYDRTSLEVIPGVFAFVYHGKTVDPEKYVKTQNPGQQPQNPQSPPKRQGKGVRVFSVTKEGRLNIPLRLMQKINVCRKDKVFCHQDGNTLVVSGTYDSSRPGKVCSMTDRLRLSRDYVQKVFNNSTKFTASVEDVVNSQEKRIRVAAV